MEPITEEGDSSSVTDTARSKDKDKDSPAHINLASLGSFSPDKRVLPSTTAAAADGPVAGAGVAPTTPTAGGTAMKGLTRKASLETMVEKKTSVGNLTLLAKKESAINLGIKTGSAWIKSKPPQIKDELKPTVGAPKVSAHNMLSGFALLKVGAKVLDKQIDEDGNTWVQYQAVDKGPVFYAMEGGEKAGQWSKPPIFFDEVLDDEAVQEGWFLIM
jgi:hypothetical protein